MSLLSFWGAFTACSTEDDSVPENGIVGEWISSNGNLYYRFNSNSTGRYICLADEPGYNPAYPDASINNPVDPNDFTYSIGDGHIFITTTWIFGEKKIIDQEDYLYDLSGNTLQLKCVRYTNSEGEWIDASSQSWDVYHRK